MSDTTTIDVSEILAARGRALDLYNEARDRCDKIQARRAEIVAAIQATEHKAEQVEADSLTAVADAIEAGKAPPKTGIGAIRESLAELKIQLRAIDSRTGELERQQAGCEAQLRSAEADLVLAALAIRRAAFEQALATLESLAGDVIKLGAAAKACDADGDPGHWQDRHIAVLDAGGSVVIRSGDLLAAACGEPDADWLRSILSELETLAGGQDQEEAAQ